MTSAAAPFRSPRTTEAAFGIAPAVVLLAPGLLLVGPWAPLRETSVRTALLFVWLAVVLQGARARPTRATWVLAALGLLAGLGMWLHPSRLPLAVGGSLVLAALPAGIVAAGGWPLDESAARRAFPWIGLAGVVAALWVLVDRAAGRPPVGPFGRTGVAGPTLAALLPFVHFASARWLPPRGLARAVPLAVLAAGLLVTGSRTGWIAGAFAGAWTVAGAVPAPWSMRIRLAIPVALGVLFALAWLSVEGRIGASAIGRTDTVRVRIGLGRAAKQLVRERPLSGHGAESFRSEVLRVRDPEEARISGERRPVTAHQDFLHVGVEGGVVAAAGLLGLVGAALALAGRRRRDRPEGERRVADACFAVVLAVGLSALAEDPFLEAPTVLLFGVAAGTALSLPRAVAARGTLLGTGLRVLAGVPLLLAGILHARAGVADALALRGDPALALAAWPLQGDALYLRAVRFARDRPPEEAHAAYRALLATDPGRTEARLDRATLYRLEARTEDARTVLEDARRRDPTRYEVRLALGHLLLGDEPPPSRRAPPADPVAILRAYNEAAAFEGRDGRFETHVAYARVSRRLGRLEEARDHLRTAELTARRRGPGQPAELWLEQFRLVEAKGAHDQDVLALLLFALAADPRLDAVVEREAQRFLDAAEEAEAAAKAKVPETMKLDTTVADADFAAAAIRLAGVLLADPKRAPATRATARALAAEGRHRRALAIYRALLADPYATSDPDLAFEAAKSAARVDAALQRTYSARGRTLLGYEALEKGDLPAALRDFEAAVDKAPDDAAGLYGLAKVRARQGQREAARDALKRAALHDPSVRKHAASDPDLAGLD